MSEVQISSHPVHLGFVGFGEAAHRFAKDLSAARIGPIVAYSPSGAKAGADDAIRGRAAQAGVELVGTPRELCERASLIIALTPGSAALRALRKMLPHLRAHHLYVDASTSSVADMEKGAELVRDRAGFVDAAVMDPVPMNGIRVLTVASGPHAERFRQILVPYGMNILVVGAKPGAASAMKLIRSICMKGLAALLLESLEAGQRYGIADVLVSDMARFFDGRRFEDVIKRFVCGTAIHAGRRIHEMSESLALLRSLESSTRMTRSTRAVLQDIERMDLRARFDAREPATIGPVLDALIELKGARWAAREPQGSD